MAVSAGVADMWVVWSEEHGAWWGPGRVGYYTSLMRAGRYTEAEARAIEAKANRYLPEGRAHEVAMPDPWPRIHLPEDHHRCSRCRRILPEDSFYRKYRYNGKDCIEGRFQTYCKECNQAANSDWRARKREEAALRAASAPATNPK